MNKKMLVVMLLCVVSLCTVGKAGWIPFSYQQFDLDPIWETYGSSKITPAVFTWEYSPSIGSARLGPVYSPTTESKLWAVVPKVGNPIKYRLSFLYAISGCQEDTLKVTAGLLSTTIYGSASPWTTFSVEIPTSVLPYNTITIGFLFKPFYPGSPAVGGSTVWITNVHLDPVY